VVCDQRLYVVTLVRSVFGVFALVLQSTMLIVTGEYLLYLVSRIMVLTIEDIVINRYADKNYPCLKLKSNVTKEYKKSLWRHRPITDFWQISHGTASRLAKYGIFDMETLTKFPEELLYKVFGINAELLIDHAWGRESCTIADIKGYKAKSKSLSSSQILFEDYGFEGAWLVMKEMVLSLCQELIKKGKIAGNVEIYVGYSGDCRPPTGGSVKINGGSNLFSTLSSYTEEIYRKTTDNSFPIRRLGISVGGVVDKGCQGYDFFTDVEAMEKEMHLEKTVLGIKSKFGKSAILRGFDLEDGATALIRNKLVGGHNGE
jgi:DNA polymerase V